MPPVGAISLGLEFVAEVGKGVVFALAYGADRGIDGSDEVGAVAAGAGEFGAEPGDFYVERRGVGECGVDVVPDVVENRRCCGESGDDVAGGAVSGGDLLKINSRVVRSVWRVGIASFGRREEIRN